MNMAVHRKKFSWIRDGNSFCFLREQDIETDGLTVNLVIDNNQLDNKGRKT